MSEGSPAAPSCDRTEDESDQLSEEAIFGSHRLAAALHPASLSFALLGLLLTTFASSALYRSQKEALATEFHANLESVYQDLRHRLDETERLLNTARAYLEASGGADTITSNGGWGAFVEGLDAPERFPGIRGLGYAAVLGSEGLDAFEASVRGAGIKDFEVRSNGSNPLYVPVLRYSALSGGCRARAAAVPGLDLLAVPTGAEALAWARDSGAFSVSTVGSLGEDFGPGGGKAFLVCLPVYSQGERPGTKAERRASIQGYLFCIAEIDKFLGGVVSRSNSDIGLRIVDSDGGERGMPFFASAEASVSSDFRSSMDVHLGGQRWTIEAFSLAAFENWVDRLSTLFVALSGVAITLVGMMVLADSKVMQERAAAHARRTSESLRVSEAEVRKLNAGLEALVVARTASLEEANSELRAFSYTVSHDLRAPVRHVQCLTELLQEEHGAEFSAGARDYFERIRAAAERMHWLIEEMLRLASCSQVALRPRRIDLSAMAKEIVEELLPTMRGRAVQIDVAPGMEIDADPVVLRTVLQNLVENAFKFSSGRELAEVSVGMAEGPEGVEILVRDNGVGFDMAQAEAVFQPFKQLHREGGYEGSGVGLATVRKMVRRHGGEVRAESEEGVGTTFRFRLGQARAAMDRGSEGALETSGEGDSAPLLLAR